MNMGIGIILKDMLVFYLIILQKGLNFNYPKIYQNLF